METGKHGSKQGKGKREGSGGGKSPAGAAGEGPGQAAAADANGGRFCADGAKGTAAAGAGAGMVTRKSGKGAEREEGGARRQGEEDELGVDWFVQARLEGTLLCAPADGVERRFTSFFSRVALELDAKAFPDVAAVEVSSCCRWCWRF